MTSKTPSPTAVVVNVRSRCPRCGRAGGVAVAAFFAYLTNPVYGWGPFCERTSADVPAQICFDWNRPRHTAEDAVPPSCI